MTGNGNGNLLPLDKLTPETVPLVLVSHEGRIKTLERNWEKFMEDWEEGKRWRRGAMYQTVLTMVGWALTLYLALRR